MMKTIDQVAITNLPTTIDSAAVQRKQAKLKRERARIARRRERRVTYDLPPMLRENIQRLAEEQRIPASQLAALALIRFLDDWEGGRVDISIYKRPSLSPRYDWNLALPRKWLRSAAGEHLFSNTHRWEE